MFHISSISIHRSSICLLICLYFVRPRCLSEHIRKPDQFCTFTCTEATNQSDLAVSAHNKRSPGASRGSIPILFVWSKHVFIAQLSEASVGFLFHPLDLRSAALKSDHVASSPPRRLDFRRVSGRMFVAVFVRVCVCARLCCGRKPRQHNAKPYPGRDEKFNG